MDCYMVYNSFKKNSTNFVLTLHKSLQSILKLLQHFQNYSLCIQPKKRQFKEITRNVLKLLKLELHLFVSAPVGCHCCHKMILRSALQGVQQCVKGLKNENKLISEEQVGRKKAELWIIDSSSQAYMSQDVGIKVDSLNWFISKCICY